MRATLVMLAVVGFAAGCSKSKPNATDSPDTGTPGSPAKPEALVKLVPGQPVGEPGGKVILSDETFLRKNAADKDPPPGGTVTGKVVKGNSFAGVAETRFVRLVPPGQADWHYEVRPIGEMPLRLQVEKDAIRSLGVEQDRGVLFLTTAGNDGKTKHPTTEYNPGLKWIDQPYEIFDTKGVRVSKSVP